MTRIMIIVGSVRPGRVGLPVAEWVRQVAADADGVETDLVDLTAPALPLMDEPNHPRLRQYTKQHTKDWSRRVEAADAVILVTPEYNHSYAPALKNALDYLSHEWWRLPVAFVSYGGVSAGTRGVTALQPVLDNVGMVGTTANVEIPFVGSRVADGRFDPSESQVKTLQTAVAELVELAGVLAPIRSAARER